MRDAKGKHISADPAKPGPWSATGENHPSEPGEPELRYTPEQQELLEQGLRILARLAVRAYLRREASLPTTDPGEQQIDNPAED